MLTEKSITLLKAKAASEGTSLSLWIFADSGRGMSRSLSAAYRSIRIYGDYLDISKFGFVLDSAACDGQVAVAGADRVDERLFAFVLSQ